jgi:uncharacterized protein YjbJ (UPF0337 family)
MGKWRQLKGKAKAAWGRALSDRGKQVAGAAEELAGVIQEKAADVKQAVEAGADRIGDSEIPAQQDGSRLPDGDAGGKRPGSSRAD